MYRKHMTDEKNCKFKQMMWQNAHTGVCVEQLYPEVDSIEIHYIRDHSSAFGSSHRDDVWKVTPQSEACFIIECLNPECSTIGFDLGSVISSAIHYHKTEVSGEMDCEGQEAPDHPEQSCDGHVEYTIKIVYK